MLTWLLQNSFRRCIKMAIVHDIAEGQYILSSLVFKFENFR